MSQKPFMGSYPVTVVVQEFTDVQAPVSHATDQELKRAVQRVKLALGGVAATEHVEGGDERQSAEFRLMNRIGGSRLA